MTPSDKFRELVGLNGVRFRSTSGWHVGMYDCRDGISDDRHVQLLCDIVDKYTTSVYGEGKGPILVNIFSDTRYGTDNMLTFVSDEESHREGLIKICEVLDIVFDGEKHDLTFITVVSVCTSTHDSYNRQEELLVGYAREIQRGNA